LFVVFNYEYFLTGIKKYWQMAS